MRRIAFVIYPGYSVIALAAVSVFETANMLEGQTLYDLRFVSESGGAVETSSRLQLVSELFSDTPGDTLVIGGATFPKPSTQSMIEFVCLAPKLPACCRDLYGSVRPCGSRTSGRSPRDNTLALRA
jgi:transcriptional regulator GlxA family with amidase domain